MKELRFQNKKLLTLYKEKIDSLKNIHNFTLLYLYFDKKRTYALKCKSNESKYAYHSWSYTYIYTYLPAQHYYNNSYNH